VLVVVYKTIALYSNERDVEEKGRDHRKRTVRVIREELGSPQVCRPFFFFPPPPPPPPPPLPPPPPPPPPPHPPPPPPPLMIFFFFFFFFFRPGLFLDRAKVVARICRRGRIHAKFWSEQYIAVPRRTALVGCWAQGHVPAGELIFLCVSLYSLIGFRVFCQTRLARLQQRKPLSPNLRFEYGYS